MSNNRHVGAVILAAGKGTRMGMEDSNKVTMLLGNKPIIRHAVERLDKMHIEPVVIVLGFAKESVQKALEGTNVAYAQQSEQLGTAHAVACALEKIPSDVSDVLVIQGDDSAFYTEDILHKLIAKHTSSDAVATLLTINVHNPKGLGRVIRDENDKMLGIVEEKDATDEQRQITEVNPACYIFKKSYLEEYLPKIEKSSVTGEYYLPRLIDLAVSNMLPLEAINVGHIPWRGVNTPEELREAEELFTNLDVCNK